MILDYDGKAIEIKMTDMAVAFKLPIKSRDISGSGSSTEKLDEGTKAKSLSVSGRIAMVNAADMTELVKLAEARESDGERKIYTIIDDTADAGGIDRVQFSSDLDVREINGIRGWNVTFTLSEFLSTSEKVEKMKKAGYTSVTAATASADGTAVASESELALIDEGNMGIVRKIAKWANDALKELEQE